jgi:succinylglutamate desuccinylase
MDDQSRRCEANQAVAAQALAAGDLAHLAQAFADAGCTVRLPAPGMLQLSPPSAGKQAMRLLLSVGIHGDETAPIEILSRILHDLAQAPCRLAPDLELMLAVGNMDAIAAGRRFVEADLNRMFRDERGDLEGTAEARRADEIMRATAQFFDGGRENWHLDLHTAIRPSHYPVFAVVPDAIPATAKRALLGCLGAGGIEAAILNSASAGTFSACTAERFGAVSATVELGQIGGFGCNDLERFAAASGMIDAFLTSGVPPSGAPPAVFRVAQQLVKHSADFRMAFDRTTWNFTKMHPGELIAEDGDVAYRVGSEPEYVVFPNPDVRPGLRAGLMVVESDI